MRITTVAVPLVFSSLALAQPLSAQDYDLSWSPGAEVSSISVSIEATQSFPVEQVAVGGQAYSTLAIRHGREIREKGFPALNQILFTLQVQEPVDLEVVVTDLEFDEHILAAPWIPSKGVLYRSQDPASVPLSISAMSLVDQDYPFGFKGFVRSGEHFRIRHVRGYQFGVAPIMVNTVQGRAKVLKRLSLELRPRAANAQVTNRAPEPPTILRENISLYQAIFPNFEWPYEISDGEGDILVVHTARDASAIQAYVNHKQKLGFNVTTEQVATGTEVRSLIQNAYANNNNLLYVLNVGDWADIKCETNSGGSPEDSELGMVAGSDNFVDIAVGRLSAESADHVTTQVDKIITYEQNLNDPFWTGTLGIGSSEGSGSGDDDEKDSDHIDIIIENKLVPNGWTSTHKEYAPGASASGVASAVNAGVHVVNYCGHGNASSWSTTGFSSSHVNNLSNGTKMPILFSVACLNGTYHRGTCFAEAWMRKKNGGAVATLMATISQPWVPPMIGQDYLNDLLSGGYDYSANPGSGTTTDHGKIRLGSLIFNAFNLWYSESSSSSDLDTIKTWVLFGDPALQINPSDNEPTADFAYVVTDLTVSFTDTSTDNGSITAWSWSFGDGATSTAQHPAHNYANADTYSVTLEVTDNDGLTGTTTKSINVGPQPPEANFSFAVDGLTMTFQDQSSDNGTITAWDWSYGDGHTATNQNPTHTYAGDGTYNVTLEVTDNDGLTDSVTKAVTVSDVVDYCASQSQNYDEEWIVNVEVGSFSYASGQSPYSDFTAQIIDLDLSQTYAVAITPDFNGGSWTEYFRVWIDYNRNGDFSDTGEEVFAASAQSAVSGEFTVPTAATDKLTRMRVSMKYDSAPDPCETFSYGEVEDYSVRFGAGGNVPPTIEITSPTDGTQFNAGDDVVIDATASDPDGSVARVEFYAGSTKLGQDATSPYTYTWTNVAAGSYSLTAVAIDDQNASTTAAAVGILVSSGGCTTLYATDFEADAGGWAHSTADSTCTTGDWGVGDPDYVSSSGVVTQLEDDHTEVPGTNALFTEPNSGGAGTNDVDGGVCTAYSPTIDASGYASVQLSLWYYHGQRDQGDDSSGDYFRIDLSRDGGATYAASLVTIGDVTHNAQWSEISVLVDDPGQLKLRVQAADGSGPGDLVEGGIDDVVICVP